MSLENNYADKYKQFLQNILKNIQSDKLVLNNLQLLFISPN